MWFAFYDQMFELYDTEDKAKAVAEKCLEDCRDEAVDGWCEESLNICWGKVHQHVEITLEREKNDDDFVSGDIDIIQVRELVSTESG